MLKRWAAWPPGIRWLAGIAAVVLAAAIVWALFVPLADWLARHDVGPAKPALLQAARDAARGRLLTLVAGLFAAGALVFTALNFNLSREGQVTDRYTKAIEQLGSDKLDVRIGGIYALERVARPMRTNGRKSGAGGVHGAVLTDTPMLAAALHLRGQELSLRDIADRLVIATGKKKGQHPSPATVMRMLREHDEKAAAADANLVMG